MVEDLVNDDARESDRWRKGAIRRRAPLYPRLVGPAWMTLDEAVRGAHLEGGSFQGAGVFRARHGTSHIP